MLNFASITSILGVLSAEGAWENQGVCAKRSSHDHVDDVKKKTLGRHLVTDKSLNMSCEMKEKRFDIVAIFSSAGN